MNYEVKEFIKDNQELIKDKAWDQVYDNAQITLDSSSTGELTKTLLSVGIDPIEQAGLDYIPEYYLSDTRIKEFNIPDTVHLLGEGCFSYTQLKKIIVPESVTQIGAYAFYESDIEEIWIMGHIEDLGAQAFHNCNGILYCKKDSTVDVYLAGNDDCNFDLRYID